MQYVVFTIAPLHSDFKVLYIMYVVIAAVVVLAVTIIASLLSINRVEVDISTGDIKLFSPLKQRRILVNDVTDFSETVHRNGYKEWHGILLTLKDNTTIQLAGQNINNIDDFKQYLYEKNINCSGKTKMRFPFK